MNILMVEDDPAEAELALTAFEEVSKDVRVVVVGDGVEAIAFVKQEAGYQDAPTPDLMLLDLNLPRKDGRAVLRELKVDPILCQIPVLVLSNSDDQGDIEQVYRLNGNCYLVKPPDMDGMFTLATLVLDFWSTAELPTRSRRKTEGEA